MRKHVFQKFVEMLEDKGRVTCTWSLEPEEQVAIFLYCAVTNVSNQKLAERFQHSGATISKYATIFFNFFIQ